MIDSEGAVYSAVAGGLKGRCGEIVDEMLINFPDLMGRYPSGSNSILVSGEYIDSVPRFPAVTILETDNAVYEKMRTDRIENAAKLLYEVNIFSNIVGYKKAEAKAILAVVDDEFEKLGFTRISCVPAPNLQDATIYRIIARYEGVIGKEMRIYTH